MAYDPSDALAALSAYNAPGSDGPPGADLGPPPGTTGAPQDPYADTGVPSPQDPYASPAPTSPVDLNGGVPVPKQLPAGFNPDQAPQDPYSGKPLSPEDQAAADEETTNKRQERDSAASGVASNHAATDVLDARAQNQIATNDKQAQEDAAYRRAQVADHAAADQATAKWMQDLDKQSKAEPNPHRWFDNTSGFGKALWALSLTFGALSVAKGAKSNIGLDMMNDEINADIQRQRETLAKQLEAVKARGGVIDKKHARDLADLSDFHTARVLRLNALSNALDLKAQTAGLSDQDKATILASKAAVDGERVKQAQAKLKEIQTVKEKALDRRTEMAKVYAAQAGENTRQDKLLKHQTDEHALDRADAEFKNDADRQAKYDLAAEAAAAKASRAKGAGADDIEIPQSGGAYLYNPQTGDKQNISVHKELGKGAIPDIQNFTAKSNGLAEMHKVLTEGGGLEQKVFHNDNDIESALQRLADPIVKQQGGRLTKDSAKLVIEQTLGEDYDSLIGRLKGGGTDDLVKLIDKQMSALPLQAQAKLGTYPGNLTTLEKQGYKVHFDAPDTQAPEAPELKGGAQVKAATGITPAHPHITDSESAAKYGDEVVNDLDPRVRSAVTTAIQSFGGLESSDIAATAAKEGYAPLAALAKAHPELAGDVKDAEALLAQRQLKAQYEAGDALRDLTSDLQQRIHHEGHPTLEDAIATATKLHLSGIRREELINLLQHLESEHQKESR